MLYDICCMITNRTNNGFSLITNDISDLSSETRLGMDVMFLV
jgi:hypothetical protein